MAEYTRTEVPQPIYVEYSVPSPACWVEVEKALAAAKQELSHCRLSDERIMVIARDDEVVIRFVKPLPPRLVDKSVP